MSDLISSGRAFSAVWLSSGAFASKIDCFSLRCVLPGVLTLLPSALMLGSSTLLGLYKSIVSVADFSKLLVLVREVSAPGIYDFLILVLINVDRSVI